MSSSKAYLVEVSSDGMTFSDSTPLIDAASSVNDSSSSDDHAASATDPHASGGPGFLKKGGVWASVYTLSAMSLGVGVFVLPIVLRDLGVITGLVAIAVFGVWSYAMQMLLVAETRAHDPMPRTYEDLVERVLGRLGKFLLALFTVVTVLIANAAHMKTVVYMLHDLLEWYITGDYGKVACDKRKELILYALLLGIALIYSVSAKIGDMRHISTASVGVVVVTSIWVTLECMLWYWPQGHSSFTGPNAAPLIGTDWKVYAADLPSIAFAFSSTFCLFPVFAEANDKSDSGVRRMVGISTIICSLGYQVVGVVGVLTFGSKVATDPFTGGSASNYLYDFPPDHYVVTVLCLALIVVITLLYGVINYPLFNATYQIVEMLPIPSAIDYRAAFIKSRFSRVFLTLCSMVVVVLVNLQFDNLVSLFGLCGGWGVGFVVYFIPSLIGIFGNQELFTMYKASLVLSAMGICTITALYTYATFG